MKIYRVSEHHFFGTPEHRIIGLFAFDSKKAAINFADICNHDKNKPDYIEFKVMEEPVFHSVSDVFTFAGPIKFVTKQIYQPSNN